MTLIELLPAVCDLSLYRGDSFEQLFTWEQPAGTPVDLTSYIITAQVRLKPDDAAVLQAFTVVMTAPLVGQFTLVLTDDETQALPKKPMYWDVQAAVGSYKRTIMAGKVKLTKDVTRP